MEDIPYHKEDAHTEDTAADSGDKRRLSLFDTGSEDEEDPSNGRECRAESRDKQARGRTCCAVREDLETKTNETEGLGEELGQHPTTESVHELQEELRQEDRVKEMQRTNSEQIYLV